MSVMCDKDHNWSTWEAWKEKVRDAPRRSGQNAVELQQERVSKTQPPALVERGADEEGEKKKCTDYNDIYIPHLPLPSSQTQAA